MRALSISIVILLVTLLAIPAQSQNTEDSFVYGDLLPDAPVLSARGDYPVGVQTVELVNKGQLDILNSSRDLDSLYDRAITVEVWYPARINDGREEVEIYDEVMGNLGTEGRPIIPFTFKGRASRGAMPMRSDEPYPLIIVSHGYTGSRLMFTYLTENLASKGYVVVSIDHTESNYDDAGGFNSTLLNRSLDDLFVLNEMARLKEDPNSFLHKLVNSDMTALMGFSMGGYGVINVAGAGYSKMGAGFFANMSKGNDALQQRVAGNPVFEASIDSRIKAVVAFAPWGMMRGAWDATGLAGIRIPSFFIAGSQDDVSGYEKGTKAIFQGAVNSDRYLLTYLNARHNVAANPAPPESLRPGLHLDEYLRYAEPAWDQRRINNINQHFITAFLGVHLKMEDEHTQYLDLNEDSNDENWKGFKPRTSVGLQLHYLPAAE